MSRPRSGSTPASDALFAAAREGDMPSLGKLFDCYRGMVVGVCAGVLGRSHLLADAVQEVFLKLLLSVGEIRSASGLGPWLGTVARNTAIDLLKAERRRAPAADGRRAAAACPLDELVRDEEERAVLKAVMRLPPDYREVIFLRYLHSSSYAEIAQTLGVPVSTVETRLHRARKKLAGIVGARSDGL